MRCVRPSSSWQSAQNSTHSAASLQARNVCRCVHVLPCSAARIPFICNSLFLPLTRSLSPSLFALCSLCSTLTPRICVRHSLNYTSFVWVLNETTAAWTMLNASPSPSFIRLSRRWRRKRFNARAAVSLLCISVSATFFRHTSMLLHQKRFVYRCDRTHNPRQFFLVHRSFRSDAMLSATMWPWRISVFVNKFSTKIEKRKGTKPRKIE